MVEAASSGCIDYTKADSKDHKFLLKENWICENIQKSKNLEVAKEQLAVLRQMLVTQDGIDAYSKYFETFKDTLLGTPLSATSSSLERYNNLYKGVTEKDQKDLRDHLENRADVQEQTQSNTDKLQARADALITEKFKRRVQ